MSCLNEDCIFTCNLKRKEKKEKMKNQVIFIVVAQFTAFTYLFQFKYFGNLVEFEQVFGFSSLFRRQNLDMYVITQFDKIIELLLDQEEKG